MAVGNGLPCEGAVCKEEGIGGAKGDDKYGLANELVVGSMDGMVAELQADVGVGIGEAAVVEPGVPYAVVVYEGGGVDFVVVEGMGKDKCNRERVVESAEGVGEDVEA